jgi:ACS family pantothenate transporter-like MFS transporter
MNLLQGAVQAWVSLLIWKQVEAPKYHKGFVTIAILTAIYMLLALVIRFFQNRQDAQKERSDQ